MVRHPIAYVSDQIVQEALNRLELNHSFIQFDKEKEKVTTFLNDEFYISQHYISLPFFVRAYINGTLQKYLNKGF